MIPYSHSELVDRAKHWLETYSGRQGNFRCGFAVAEYSCNSNEIPDAIGFRSDRTILIECKVSRSDFFADGQKRHRQYKVRLGNYRFYLVPAGLISKEETPDGWGLLFANPKNITIEVKPPLHAEHEIKQAEYYLLYSLLRRANLRGYLPELTKPLETPVFDPRSLKAISTK